MHCPSYYMHSNKVLPPQGMAFSLEWGERLQTLRKIESLLFTLESMHECSLTSSSTIIVRALTVEANVLSTWFLCALTILSKWKWKNHHRWSHVMRSTVHVKSSVISVYHLISLALDRLIWWSNGLVYCTCPTRCIGLDHTKFLLSFFLYFTF